MLASAAVRALSGGVMRFRYFAVIGLGLLSFGCSEKVAPFELYSVDGKQTYSLDSFKGKVVMLDFWATWCGPCRQVQPTIRMMAQQYAGGGLQVLGVTNESPTTVSDFVLHNPLGYPAVIDRGERVGNEFAVHGIPTVVIIDRDGSLAYSGTPPDLKQVSTILNRLTPAK